MAVQDTNVIDEMLTRLQGKSLQELTVLNDESEKILRGVKFVPNPGKQTEAYNSEADILLYGGQAGVGKGFLVMGLAGQQHRSAIVFRREASQLDGLERDGKTIYGPNVDYNGSDHEWTWYDKAENVERTVKLAGMKEPEDWRKQAGRERDLIAFDEATEFLEVQVASCLGWNRGPTGQRCRMVLATNPPRSQDGYWVNKWFAPWLDDAFEKPAKFGELRYTFDPTAERIEWVDKDARQVIDDIEVKPLSLTFIPAKLSDNPYRNTPEYKAKLNSLPEPLRSQLLFGDFKAGVRDDMWQIIPTAWVKASMAKWTPEPPDGVPMCAIAADIAQGGDDTTVLASRYDGWYNPLVVVPGIETPDGPSVAGLIIQHRRDNAMIIPDMGGGYGGSTFDHLKANLDRKYLLPWKGAEASGARTADKQLGFASKRMQAHWQFREALDPSQTGGSPIILPPDPILLADLTAPRYEIGSNGIKFRSDSTKEALTKRLGRSPDRGDGVVNCWQGGAKAMTDGKNWDDTRARRGRAPAVISGYANRRRA